MDERLRPQATPYRRSSSRPSSPTMASGAASASASGLSARVATPPRERGRDRSPQPPTVEEAPPGSGYAYSTTLRRYSSPNRVRAVSAGRGGPRSPIITRSPLTPADAANPFAPHESGFTGEAYPDTTGVFGKALHFAQKVTGRGGYEEVPERESRRDAETPSAIYAHKSVEVSRSEDSE